MPNTNDDIADEIRGLLQARSPDASICPSDVARGLHGEEGRWRALVPRVRDVARQLAADGELRMTQRGIALDPAADVRGPIRRSRGPQFTARTQ